MGRVGTNVGMGMGMGSWPQDGVKTRQLHGLCVPAGELGSISPAVQAVLQSAHSPCFSKHVKDLSLQQPVWWQPSPALLHASFLGSIVRVGTNVGTGSGGAPQYA